MITLSEVCVTFRSEVDEVKAVDHVTFSAREGEYVLLRGASGSGKSTLLNVIAGLQPLDSGSASVAGVDLVKSDERTLAQLRLRQVGVVFQENNLIREFSAEENVQLPLRARAYSSHEAAIAARSALQTVGLGGLERRMPTELSGGQRQRVGIARAVVGGKSVLVADEPTGALDSANSSAIFALLRSIADSGVCVIVASHDESAGQYADRVQSIRDGRLALAATGS
jgi:ABC-type lipoprotein export system ATPase subunit